VGALKRGEQRKPACRCFAGNDIIAGVKQPPFTLIYNPPAHPPLLLPCSSPSSPHRGARRDCKGREREREKDRESWSKKEWKLIRP